MTFRQKTSCRTNRNWSHAVAARLVFQDLNRSICYFLGAVAMMLCAYTYLGGVSPETSRIEMVDLFGYFFIAGISLAMFGAIFSGVRLHRERLVPLRRKVWYQAGLQAADIMITLGLIYTLIGLSDGLGVLSEGRLTPETAAGALNKLSKAFQLALLSTVVALPLGTGIRTAFVLAESRMQAADTHPPS